MPTPRTNSRLVAPIKLSAPTVTVTTGRSATADTGKLSTKFRRAFWIDEISWAVYATWSDAGETSAMQTRMQLGRFALSDKFIPFQNYAPRLNDFCEVGNANSSALYSWFRWKLPKPLFVPAGMTLVSEFFRPLGKTPATATVDVAYAGRYLPSNTPTPKEIDVPWVTMFAPAAASVFAQSSELDLYNPFDKPLEVQRFLFAKQDLDAVNSEYTIINQNLVTVMKDSHGVNVVRDFTATGAVFDLERRAWTFNKVLAPKERYNITLQATSGALTDYAVSLVGTRKERL